MRAWTAWNVRRKTNSFKKCAALAEAEKKTVKLTMIRIRPKTKDMIHFFKVLQHDAFWCKITKKLK